jgi:hypothetical protein
MVPVQKHTNPGTARNSTGERAVENESTMEQQKHSIGTNVGLVSARETDFWQMNQLQGPANVILRET